MVRHYNFGIEIEAVAKPYGGAECFSNVDWYRQLAQKLRNRGIEAVHDDNSRYSKHPEYYGGKWFVTRDGSLKRERPLVCMEVVSPKLNTTMHLGTTLSDFWEAMHVHFNPQKDSSCGGHVHVTPLSLNSKFSFRSLKKIAFATVLYEDYVAAVLPAGRRENKYCLPNSRSVDSGLRETLLLYSQQTDGRKGGRAQALRQIAQDIKKAPNEMELYFYMQGNRYVLWNFQNIFPNPKTGRCTGTVEFRGGSQFLGTRGTLGWVAFVLGFVSLALEEDMIREYTSSSYVGASDPKFQKSLEEWWKRVRKAARKSRMSRHLPEEYTKMKSR